MVKCYLYPKCIFRLTMYEVITQYITLEQFVLFD